MTLFKGKYRIESARLEGHDYSSPGEYFVTVCTRGMVCEFGGVVGGQMRLSRIGEIVDNEWQETARVRANITLDKWIVMPNHLHGILVIGANTRLSKM